jgi:hypothetical protein
MARDKGGKKKGIKERMRRTVQDREEIETGK